jgi:hypothetical protein
MKRSDGEVSDSSQLAAKTQKLAVRTSAGVERYSIFIYTALHCYKFNFEENRKDNVLSKKNYRQQESHFKAVL